MPPRSYRDLRVWQHAFELGIHAYRLTESFPTGKGGELASQIRRSALSVPANIAEGNGRTHRGEYLRVLSIAHASLTELESHLRFAECLGYGSPHQAEGALVLAAETGRMLRGLMRALEASVHTRRPAPPTPAPPPAS